MNTRKNIERIIDTCRKSNCETCHSEADCDLLWLNLEVSSIATIPENWSDEDVNYIVKFLKEKDKQK